MASTYVGTDDRGTYSNSGSAISSGDVISIASGTSGRIGIALADIAATTGTGTYIRNGRHTLPKNAGEAMTLEQVVYWDGTEITGTSSSAFTRAGRVAAAAASAATTVDVFINAP